MRKKIFISALCSVMLATALWLWWPWRSQPPTPATGLRAAVRIAISRSLVAAPMWVAVTQGFYREAGVEPVLIEFDAGRDALNAMLRGEADLATLADTPLGLKLFEREDFAIVTPIATTEVLSRIITRTDTGIRQVADLRGKKITTAKGTATDFTLYAALLRSGLSLADVERIDAVPTAALEMLRDHAVDAVVLWEPHASRAEEMLQQGAVTLATPELYRSSYNLVVRSAFATQYPEVVERVVRAVYAATVFMRQHNAQAYQITVEWLRPYATLTEAVWKEPTFTLTLDQAWLTTLEDIARWAIRQQHPEGTSMPNILRRIYFDALEHVKPDEIMLMR